MKKKINKKSASGLTHNVPVQKQRNDYSLHGQIKNEYQKNPETWTNRILIAVPTTGVCRVEWMMARYGQIIPTNWSQVEMVQWMSTYSPLEYQLPDAENLIAKHVVEGDYEWFLSIEQDNLIPPDAFIRINEYMTENKVPIVSGLYYTKSQPPEPILYRGRGNGSFRDFKLGDKVWCDGIPFGFTLIHGSIIRALWNESEEYMVGNEVTRRVFELPNFNVGNYGFDNSDTDTEGKARFAYTRGTTDLNFCKRVMKDKIFEKAGWPELQKKKYPFLVDTNIFVRHIDLTGRQYPIFVPKQQQPIPGVKPKEIK
ncbi:MAG: hypothetical protein WC069_06015 [Candidatus Shapirobacteria bacterium]